MRSKSWFWAFAAISLCSRPALAGPCDWSFPVGNAPEAPAPLSNNHPVNGNNLPSFGKHLGADFWSGGGCTDFGQAVYAVADGQVVEIVDGLGSYLDVVVIRHQVPELGNIYSMYGHIEREGGLGEGQMVEAREKIGEIDDVLAYFSPCHLHFELLNEAAFQSGPFCNGCQNAGFHVSPGYDQQQGVNLGAAVTGDDYIEVSDNVADNRWYFVSEFLAARVGMECGVCGDGICDPEEDAGSCPADCGGGDGDTGGDGDSGDSGDGDTGWSGDGSEADMGDGDGDGDGWDSESTGGQTEGSGTEGGEGTDGGSEGDDGFVTGPGFNDDGIDPLEPACACSSERPGPRGLGLIGLFALLGLARGRRGRECKLRR